MAVDGVRFPANPLACNHYKIGLSVKEHRKTARSIYPMHLPSGLDAGGAVKHPTLKTGAVPCFMCGRPVSWRHCRLIHHQFATGHGSR